MASSDPVPPTSSPEPIDPRRSAHRTIHGFLYQSVLTAHRWLDLRERELLFCEGDEDYDVLSATGRVATQVKAYEEALGLNDVAVRESLANFATTFAARSEAGIDERFVFVTTAPARRSGASGRILDAWRQGPAVDGVAPIVAFLRELLQELPPATARWFDADPARWPALVAAVEWRFDTPDFVEQMAALQQRLERDARGRHLPAQLLAKRLLIEVTEAARHREPVQRCVDAARLTQLFAETTESIDRSLRRHENAARLLAVEDARRLSERLVPGTELRPETITGVGQLLGAAYETVPWNDRLHGEQLDGLVRWCGEAPTIEVRLLTGEGGAGKTRLAIELVRRVRAAGWQAGFLRDPPAKARLLDEEVDLLLRGSDPRLIVIDYAETRQGWLTHLLGVLAEAVAAKRATAPVRLLLVARNAGDWWASLKRQRKALATWLEAVVLQELPPLAVEPATREEFFWQSVATFRRLLEKTPAGNSPEFAPDLTDASFDRMLFLQMAALALVEGKVVRGRAEILEATLDHERRFWRRECDHFGGGDAAAGGDAVQRGKLLKTFPPAVAALTLINGAVDEEEARRYLARITQPKSGDLPLDLGTLLERLRSIYAADRRSGAAARYLTGLEPDLLGEYQAGCLLRELSARTEEGRHPFLELLFPDDQEPKVAQAFAVLGRAAVDDSRHEEWIRSLLVGRVSTRAEQVLRVALAIATRTAHSPLGNILARVLEEEGDTALARLLEPLIPHPTVSLVEVARWATAKLMASPSAGEAEGHAEDGVETVEERVRLANNASILLHDSGDHQGALQMARVAVEGSRELKQLDSKRHAYQHACALATLSNRLSNLNLCDEALGVAREATAEFCNLHRLRPGEVDADLSGSLNNLADRWHDLGRPDEALKSMSRAAILLRRRSAARPEESRASLARVSMNRGMSLRLLKRRERAVRAFRRGTAQYRALAIVGPDAYEPDLAKALHNLGSALGEMDLPQEALQFLEEAVTLRRRLAQTHPARFAPQLANSLNDLSSALAAAGQPAEAVRATREAIEIILPHAQRCPDAHRRSAALLVLNYERHCAEARQSPDTALMHALSAAAQTPRLHP